MQMTQFLLLLSLCCQTLNSIQHSEPQLRVAFSQTEDYVLVQKSHPTPVSAEPLAERLFDRILSIDIIDVKTGDSKEICFPRGISNLTNRYSLPNGFILEGFQKELFPRTSLYHLDVTNGQLNSFADSLLKNATLIDIVSYEETYLLIVQTFLEHDTKAALTKNPGDQVCVSFYEFPSISKYGDTRRLSPKPKSSILYFNCAVWRDRLIMPIQCGDGQELLLYGIGNGSIEYVPVTGEVVSVLENKDGPLCLVTTSNRYLIHRIVGSEEPRLQALGDIESSGDDKVMLSTSRFVCFDSNLGRLSIFDITESPAVKSEQAVLAQNVFLSPTGNLLVLQNREQQIEIWPWVDGEFKRPKPHDED
jgi:hypothetical protein